MMVICDMDGKVVEGDFRPSSDTPIHLELYRSFAAIGGVCHTHSPQATLIVRRFKDLDPERMPAVLVANHGLGRGFLMA